MEAWDEDQFLPFSKYEDCMERGEFGDLPILMEDVGLLLPLRQTRQRDPNSELEDVESDTDTENADNPKICSLKHQGVAMNNAPENEGEVLSTFFDEIDKKEKAASLLPILKHARDLNNESSLLQLTEFIPLAEMYPAQKKGVRNLCMNTACDIPVSFIIAKTSLVYSILSMQDEGKQKESEENQKGKKSQKRTESTRGT